MGNIELKPCPLCGGSAELVEYGGYAVRCSSCYLLLTDEGVFGFEDKEEAASKWNTRAIYPSYCQNCEARTVSECDS